MALVAIGMASGRAGVKLIRFAAAVALVVAMGSAQAALHDRGGGLIYDDVLNITWLQDANYAKTSGYDADGLMTWGDANAWAASLVYSGFGDWRLPFIVDTGSVGCNLSNGGTDCGFNVQTVSGNTVYSEMAHMYYANLSLLPRVNGETRWGIFGNGTYNGVNADSYGQNDVGLIRNLQAFAYWSSTERDVDPANLISIGAWNFGTADGFQDTNYKSQELYAWAVRDGDVSPVPAPPAFILMLTGLGLLGLIKRFRRADSYA